MSEKWLIIGISGVTCGGKTTLATQLHKIFPNSILISQDDYFLDVKDKRHTWIEELNHINFDVLSSLDMEKMRSDIENHLQKQLKHSTKPINTNISDKHSEINIKELQELAVRSIQVKQMKLLILEGFSIFNYSPIEKLCDIKYYMTLNRELCFERRSKRVYDPPDCPGYFDKCVWPEYIKQFNEIRNSVKDVKYFNENTNEPIRIVLSDIINHVL